MFRSFVLLLSLLGSAAFGGLLLVSLLQPTWIEHGARELIRQQIEHKTGEKLRALDERFLSAQARVFLRGKEQEIDAARKAGVRVGSVAWGYNHVDALRERGPDELIMQVADLPAVLA